MWDLHAIEGYRNLFLLGITMATKSGKPARKLHTIPATADLLECSEAHVYRLISAGVLAVVDIAMPGSRRSKTRVRDDSVNAYIDRSTRAVSAPAGDAASRKPVQAGY